MARKRKGRDLKRRGFSSADVKHALRLDGWTSASGGGHQTIWEHPIKPGKIPVSEGWTALKTWCPILRGLCRTMGVTKDELLHLLNGIKPD